MVNIIYAIQGNAKVHGRLELLDSQKLTEDFNVVHWFLYLNFNLEYLAFSILV